MTTDAEGCFELKNLIAASYEVVARGQDRRFSRLGAHEPVEPGWYVEFVPEVPELKEVAVRVTDIDGSALPHASVFISDYDAKLRERLLFLPNAHEATIGGRPTIITPSRGHRLPLVPGVSLWTRIWDGASTPPLRWRGEQQVTLRLPGNAIRVSVSYPNGCEQSVVAVGFLAVDPSRPPDREAFHFAAQWREVFSGSEWTIGRGIPAGTYWVGVRLGRFRGSGMTRWRGPVRTGHADAVAEVVVTGGLATTHLDLAALESDDGILVEAVNGRGERMSNVTFSIHIEVEGRQAEGSGLRQRRLADGRYLLTSLSEAVHAVLDGSERGEVIVSAFDSKLGRVQATVNRGPSPTAVLSFAAPGRLQLYFEGSPAAERLKKLSFRVRSPDGRVKVTTPSRVDDGIVTIDSLLPGEYDLTISASRIDLVTFEVSITEDSTTDSVVEIAPLYRVVLRSERRGGPQLWELSFEGNRVRSLSLGLEREIELYLPPGNYELRELDLKVSSERFSVPQTTELTLEDTR